MQLIEGIAIGLVVGIPAGGVLCWLYAKKLIAQAQSGLSKLG